MSGLLPIAAAVAKRNLRHAFTNPALLLPSLLFPLIFLVGFAGGLSSVEDVPGFDYEPGYTAFQYVFVYLQSAAFGGVFVGFALAADFESGFSQRLLIGAPRRFGILLGYIASAAARFAATGIFITLVALATGMQVGGGGVDLLGLVGLGLCVSVAAALWGVGLSLRIKSLQSAPLMQIPIFVALFLAPVYVPLKLLDGWIHAVASYNPATALLNAGRALLAGGAEDVAIAFACGGALVALFLIWAFRGLRRVEAGL